MKMTGVSVSTRGRYISDDTKVEPGWVMFLSEVDFDLTLILIVSCICVCRNITIAWALSYN